MPLDPDCNIAFYPNMKLPFIKSNSKETFIEVSKEDAGFEEVIDNAGQENFIELN